MIDAQWYYRTVHPRLRQNPRHDIVRSASAYRAAHCVVLTQPNCDAPLNLVALAAPGLDGANWIDTFGADPS